jgi:hypothetical protein
MSSPEGSIIHRRRTRWRQRKRRDARVKNLVKCHKNGVAVLRSSFCCAGAMPNGRCRVHGGASTGPKSPEGKLRVVAALVSAWADWLAAPAPRAAGEQPDLCRFLDAGNDETLRTLSEPASKKRRGTSHGELGTRLGSERYGV